MTRRGRRPGEWNRLPETCIAALDADGIVRGKTWRQMPTGSGTSIVTKILNWWLWKRGMLVLKEEREEARALAAFMRDSNENERGAA